MDDHQFETALETARRHVDEAQARVERQAAIVDELARRGSDATQAEAMLATMRRTLVLMQEDLARREAEASSPIHTRRGARATRSQASERPQAAEPAKEKGQEPKNS